MFDTENMPNAENPPGPRCYLTARQVKARYGGISDMSLWRWLRDENLGFPQPLIINGRRFWLEGALDRFDDKRAAKACLSGDAGEIPESKHGEVSGQEEVSDGNARLVPSSRLGGAGAGSDADTDTCVVSPTWRAASGT
jgi:predicted DNA-binding transcriptional regulator AlpA